MVDEDVCESVSSGGYAGVEGSASYRGCSAVSVVGVACEPLAVAASASAVAAAPAVVSAAAAYSAGDGS